MNFNPLLGDNVSPLHLTKSQQVELELEKFLAFRGQIGFDYMTILKALPPTVVFDISKTGTGVAYWTGETCSLDTLSIKDTEDDRDVRRQFREFVLEVFKIADFKYVIIEDVIGSLNFKTANILYQLNVIIDDLMELGLIKEVPIFREDNGVWRMFLKAVTQYESPIVSPKDTKELVQNCLQNIGLPPVWRNDNESDALGMLLGVGVVRILGYTVVAPKQNKNVDIRKGYRVEQFYENPIEDKTLKLPKAIENAHFKYHDAVGQTTDILRISKKLLKDYGTEYAYIVRIESDKLGVLLVEQGLKRTLQPSYILFYHKATFKKSNK